MNKQEKMFLREILRELDEKLYRQELLIVEQKNRLNAFRTKLDKLGELL